MILFKFPGIEKVNCLFCGREDVRAENPDGDISIAGVNGKKTRAALAAWLKKSYCQSWAECHQVHGDNMLADPAPTDIFANPENLVDADGMCSATSGLALIIKTADCQPWLLAHKSGRYIMAFHAGWRGNRISFPQKAVAAFCASYNLDPQDIFACRGPSLGPANARFQNFETEWSEDFLPWFDAKTQCMDLWNLARAQLEDAGLKPEHIFGLDICTYENPHAWFSYRRDKYCGRQASLIWIENPCR